MNNKFLNIFLLKNFLFLLSSCGKKSSTTSENTSNSDNKTTKGWNCGQDGTGSSGTGPNGGVDPSDGSLDTSSDGY